MNDFIDKHIHKLEYLNNLIMTIVAIVWIFVTPPGLIKAPGFILSVLGIIGLYNVYKRHTQLNK